MFSRESGLTDVEQVRKAEAMTSEERKRIIPPQGGSGTAKPLGRGLELIAMERLRQVDSEGFTSAHDDKHIRGELSEAGACYAAVASANIRGNASDDYTAEFMMQFRNWPWEAEWWKPETDPLGNLVKAGALIVAEIDRLLRALDK